MENFLRGFMETRAPRVRPRLALEGIALSMPRWGRREFHLFPCLLKKSHRLLVPYRRKVLKKVIDRIARFQAVQKSPRQDSRARKHRHPAENSGIACDDTENHKRNRTDQSALSQLIV